MIKLIAFKIKAVRKIAKLNQEDFAKKVGLKSPGHISDIESGKKDPGALLIDSICNKFKVDAAWLTEESDKRGYSEREGKFLDVVREKEESSTGSILSLMGDEKHKELHALLSGILNSGEASTIRAIENNLREFAEKVDEKAKINRLEGQVQSLLKEVKAIKKAEGRAP